MSPSVLVYYILMTPPPIPKTTLPEPNGYPLLVEAGKALENVTIPHEATSTEQQLAAFDQKFSNVVAKARQALDHECQVPLRYDSTDLAGFQELRNLARALVAEGRRAQQPGNHENAISLYWETVRLGNTAPRGGLVVHWLVGIAVSSTGVHALHEGRNDWTPEQRRELIARAGDYLKNLEPLEPYRKRDRVWEHRYAGWQSRLWMVLEERLGNKTFFPEPDFQDCQARHRARLELLRIELALSDYRAQHGRFPERLEELVPDYFERLPVDPFSGEPMLYRPEATRYRVYSVGPNRVDDGGVAPWSSSNTEADDVMFEAPPPTVF